MKNIPYVKEYNENGQITNPINGSYLHQFPNRRERKQEKKRVRFHGNTKGIRLTTTKNARFERKRQVVKDILGNIANTVEHYVLKLR